MWISNGKLTNDKWAIVLRAKKDIRFDQNNGRLVFVNQNNHSKKAADLINIFIDPCCSLFWTCFKQYLCVGIIPLSNVSVRKPCQATPNQTFAPLWRTNQFEHTAQPAGNVGRFFCEWNNGHPDSYPRGGKRVPLVGPSLWETLLVEYFKEKSMASEYFRKKWPTKWWIQACLLGTGTAGGLSYLR